MNKKKFARIMSMYQDGVSPRICIEAIMNMSSSSMMASIWIEKFYNKRFEEVLTYEPTNRPEPTDLANNRSDET